MSSSLIGGIAGLVLGLLSWAICQFVASRIEKAPNGAKNAAVAKGFRAVGVLVMVIDTVVGYQFFGPALAGNL